MLFGQKVRLLRRLRAMTQTDLASQTGISSHDLSLLERGIIKEPPETMRKRLEQSLGLKDPVVWSLLDQLEKQMYDN